MSGSTAAVRRVGRRGFSVAAVFAMVAVWLPAISLTSVANAADPVQVQTTLEGCRRPAPAASCAYGADFTTGNLGKNWAELDYVPHRLTLNNNGADQGFDIRLSADHLLNGVVGYDFIKAGWETPYTTASADMFSAGCGTGGDPAEILAANEVSPAGVVGGVDKVITDKLHLHMTAGATCRISFMVRLGLGAHLYSGSSLQSQVLEADYDSIGQRTVSIPVKEIAPQVASIEASASRTNNYTWSVDKSGDGPLEINSCDPDATEPNANYTVTYTRTKQSGSNYVVEGTVTLSNPSLRTLTTHDIDVTISDSDGSGDVAATVDDTTITVPAASGSGPGTNSTGFTAIVPAPIGTLTASSTVTYDDPDKPGVLLPGLDSNSVPVDITVSETDTNATADLSDTESFTGANPGKFEYKRTAPHATSGFTSGDTFTDNNLDASGSFDIHKIVRVTEPGNFTANLHNEVTITPDDGGDADTATANIAITATADDPVVTIKKAVDLAPESDATFLFTITSNDDDTKSWNTSVTIKAGELAGDSDPVTVDPSASGYTLDETAAEGYDAVNTSIGALDFCDTKDVPVQDSRQLGHVKVEKVLDGPAAGAGTHFVFDVVCDNGYETTLEVDGEGEAQTDDVIPTGVDCTITEQTPPTGWDDNPVSDPADGGVESAQEDSDANTVTITNTRLLGHITVDKSLVGDVAGASTTFTFDWNCPAVDDYAGDSGTLEVNGEGTASTGDVIPTGVSCTITENDNDGHWTLTAQSPEDGSATAAQGDDTESNTVFFTNTRNVGNITVNKTRVGQVAGASTVFVFDIVCADFPEYNQQLEIDTADAATASATSSDIPTDVTCTVTEEGTSGWQQTTPASGGVDVTVPGEASFTNTRLEGPLQLVKSVTPDTGSYNPADDNNTLTYTLTLDEPEPGQLDHTDVVVSDYIPGYDPDHTDSLKTTYVDGSATCSTGCTATYDADAHTLTWAVGDFNHDDDPVVFTFQVTIDQPEAAANGGIPAGVVDNIGAVQSLQQPKTPSNLVETPVIAVLPVRHERTPPKVLPFTGNSLPIKSAMILGMVLITAGVALTTRRRREH